MNFQETFQNPNGGGVPHIIGRYDAVTHLADGTSHVEITAAAHGMGPEEVREALAETHGIGPDDVTITSRNGEPYDRPAARRRGSVAFSSDRWRSSWNPGVDPTQN